MPISFGMNDNVISLIWVAAWNTPIVSPTTSATSSSGQVPADRRRYGWLFVLAIGIGLGDVIDTFSHLHTPLAISLLRIVNGAVLGAVTGLPVRCASRRACQA